MNGNDKKKIAGMDDGEWKVFLATKLEIVETGLNKAAKDIVSCFKAINSINITLAKMPEHCIQANEIGEHNKRLGSLERDRAGRKAVTKAVWSLFGLIGTVNTVLVILKLLKVI